MSYLKSLLKANADQAPTTFSMENFLGLLAEGQDLSGSVFNAAHGLTKSVGLESFGDAKHEETVTISAMYKNLQGLLTRSGFESFLSENSRVAENQIVAATTAAIAAENPKEYIKALRNLTKALPSTESIRTVEQSFAGPHGSLQVFQGDAAKNIGLENYNEKSQRDFRVVTVGYNLAASRQDEFAERIYPTTVINPIEGGVVQVLPYIAVLKDVHHSVTGALWDTKEVNMVEAYRDPSILDDNATDLIPAIAPGGENLKYFVDPALIAPETVVNEQNMSIETAPLKPGIKVDLMGISNANLLINANMLDVSDTIDPAGRLKALYVKFEGEVIRFKVDRMPRAVFQPDLIGDTRGAKVDFWTDDLSVSAITRTIGGAATSVITELETRKWVLRISVQFSGVVSLSKGESRFTVGECSVARILNEDRRDIDITAGPGAALVAKLADLEIIGFDLDCRFTNTNRRQRGHLLQTRALQFRHPIPMHAPVTLPLSTMDEEGPGEVVKALTVNTNIRNSNNAVKTLLNYLAQLRELTGSGFNRPSINVYEGALASVMRPTYVYGNLHLPDVIDTLKSKDRWDDVCSAILNYVKGQLFPAYRNSNIEAAFRVISGNQDERPIFLFCSDKEIANYLMTKGDDRTLGAYLEYDIVSTNNELFDGKLVVVPTRKNPTENDILSFGQFFYVSTIVADLPISRGGNQITREIAAIPFNLHINNIPFALEFDISGFADVMGTSQWNKPLIDAVKA
ncbi:major capsid protein [Pseudomonas phage Phabio]|uniref:Major capsid protein n=1 Tax=Pseudomonas phage Phabio TaxID=2006668 RepID=A0A1Y0T008_9CAUD|nr:major head protein [Pseudomonas phage Phabio]ARV76818.1 major capsid protein [Pseudomonas phage Phabio]